MPEAAPLGSPVSHTASAAALTLAMTQVGAVSPGVAAAMMGGLVGGASMQPVAGLTLGGGDGMVATGSADVIVNNRPAGRVADLVSCHSGNVVRMGSDSVFINGRPAARLGDPAADGAVIVAGSPNVIIGGGMRSASDAALMAPPCLQGASMLGAPFVRSVR